MKTTIDLKVEVFFFYNDSRKHLMYDIFSSFYWLSNDKDSKSRNINYKIITTPIFNVQILITVYDIKRIIFLFFHFILYEKKGWFVLIN